jgi:hypothetical protein
LTPKSALRVKISPLPACFQVITGELKAKISDAFTRLYAPLAKRFASWS